MKRDGKSETAIITVHRGDTLWSLARKHLGCAFRWPELWAQNAPVIVASHRAMNVTPRHPEDLIYPGTVLNLPAGEGVKS